MSGTEASTQAGTISRQLEHALRRIGGTTSGYRADTIPVGAVDLFDQAMAQTRMAMCIADPHQTDCPLVYVNRAFTTLTGYARDEVIGRNCRFLQGPGTTDASRDAIRDAVASGEVRIVEILNYRRDGTPFWNAVHVGPIFNADGEIALFYGSQWNVTDLHEAREREAKRVHEAMEAEHRTNNLFAVLGAIVRLSAREAVDARGLAESLSERFNALARAHRTALPMTGDGEAGTMDALVEALVVPYRAASDSRIELVGPSLPIRQGLVTPIGLVLHELSTNALKYGALGPAGGHVRVEWHGDGVHLLLNWTETFARRVETPDKPQGTGLGSALVQGLVKGAGGTLASMLRSDGASIRLRLPL